MRASMAHQGADLPDFDMEQFMAENPDIEANPFAGMNDPPADANLADPANSPQAQPVAANLQPITPMTATGLPLPADKSYHPDIKWFRLLDHYRPDQLPAQPHYRPGIGYCIPCSPPPLTPMEGVQTATPFGGIFGAFPAPPIMMPAPQGRPNKKRKIREIDNATVQRPGKRPRQDSIQGQVQTLTLGMVSLSDLESTTYSKCKCESTLEAKNDIVPRYEEKKAQQEIEHPDYHFKPGEKTRLDFGDAQCQCGAFATNCEQLRLQRGILLAGAAPPPALRGGMGGMAGTPAQPYGTTQYGVAQYGGSQHNGPQYGATQYGIPQYGVPHPSANPYASTQPGTTQANRQQQPPQGDVRMGNTPEFDGSEFQATPAEADRVIRSLFPDVPLPSTESFSPYVGRPLNNGPPSANTRAKSLSPFDPALLDPALFAGDGSGSLATALPEGAVHGDGGPAMRTRSKSLSPGKDGEEVQLYGVWPPK
ncbi:hypothetical protein B0A48_16533 [Cryoendolithus antarcticus]|uniref:Uncharacterized protein n=1 Tax=Cryoendolithus antarcticus TaxID=1507870 RepID=A0A1V8SF07_9PEZI|nr:hypothetical protein B0A48_16533 [Cryoendolithus antarcticus]